ncbi:MAG: hypothetical protein AABZ80_03320 [Gemmatimonadota bacterium]
MRRTVALLAVAGLAAADAVATAQGPVSVQNRVAEGRVRRPGEKGPMAVPGAWVILHRVGSDRAAPLDSLRAGGDGAFRFRYAVSGSPDAVYFVSTTFRGIAYFSTPLRERTVRAGDADLLVYDTTTVDSALSVQGRHIVVSAPRNGRREVAEIFEIENSGTRTVVPRDSTRPLLATRFPAEAESLTVAPGDLSAGAVSFRGGRGEVFAPISPGVRQLVVTYRLPARAFPLSVPVERPIGVLEVLLEEPRAVADGAGLRETEAADIDGRTFRRFVVRDVGPPAVLRIKAQTPSEGGSATILALAGTLTLAMMAGLAVWYSRRRVLWPVPLTPGVSASDVLVAELASLDARFARSGNPGAEERSHHERTRAELKARIAESLARESPRA